MKKILVINDASEVSKNACLYAHEIAKLGGAKILLYECGSEDVSRIEPKSPDAIIRPNSNHDLKRLIDVNSLKQGSKADCELFFTNISCLQDILSIEKKEDPELVIVGMKGSEISHESVLADTISALINETTVPILIVPENARFKKIEKIAFAIDFNLESELKMHKCIKFLLDFFKPEIFLLHVVKENEEIRPDQKKSEDNVERYFENMKHIYSFIQHNELIKGLKEFISQNKIDIVTMLPHQHNLFQNIFVESQTKKMALHTPIPLIIFPKCS